MADNYNKNTTHQIEEFKDWRPFFNRLDYIDMKLIEASLKKDVRNILNSMREIIIFTSPYNTEWKTHYKTINSKAKELFSETYFNSNKRIKKHLISKYEDEQNNFLDQARMIRAEIYIKLANTKLNPEAVEIQRKQSQLEDDEDKKEELEALEEIGIL